MYHLSCQLVFPALLLVFFYTSTFYKLSRRLKYQSSFRANSSLSSTKPFSIPLLNSTSMNNRKNLRHERQKIRKISYSKVKTLKLSFCIVIVFILSTLPFYVSVFIMNVLNINTNNDIEMNTDHLILRNYFK